MAVESRTLTVTSDAGLGNRLRVLLSGIALARATQREFAMRWEATDALGSEFALLFENAWNVGTEVEFDSERAYDLSHIAWADMPDFTAAAEDHLYIRNYGWLIQPTRREHHRTLEDTAKQLMAELKPMPHLWDRIRHFQQCCFRPTMIGVHLRRGDLMRWRPDATHNLDAAIKAIDRILVDKPDAGILVCTDDGAPNPYTRRAVPAEGVIEKMQARYGAKVVTTNAEAKRDSARAVEDAVVDLYLLRAADYFIGTVGSSFSEVAAFGSSIPVVSTMGATPSYIRQIRWLERMGLGGWLTKTSYHEYGKLMPPQSLFLKYRHRVRRFMRDQIPRRNR
jgi:hypothetical protein